VVGGEDGSLEWRHPTERAALIKVANSAIASLAFNSAGTVLMAGLDSGPALWINVATKAVTAVCPGQAGDSAGVGFGDGGRPQTISRDGRVRTWTRSMLLPATPLSSGAINSVAFAPSGEMAAAGGASTLVLLLDGKSLAAQKSLENRPVRAGAVQELAWSPDGQSIAAVHNDGLLNFWNRAGVNFDSASYRRTLWTASWQPDGKAVAVGASEGAVYIVPLPVPRTPPLVPVRHKDRVVSVRFSPKGDFIASSGWDNALRFTRLTSGVRVQSIDGAGVIADLAFGPAPLIAAAQWDGRVVVYDYTTGQTIATFQGHNGPVTAVVFHPQGKQIASGGKDGTVRVWDLDAGTELLRYAEHSGTVTDLTYTPDGNRLVSAGADGFVRSWAPSASDLIALAKATLARELTAAECAQYLGRESCGQYGSLRGR
jgi:WD40 repeat protein